ncbi:hypothetical protein HMPREF0372_01336 [Flavonifractor plautii ATCC 29863]|uniref:Uncharacterized protein n=1 Tax=Flavonifractor plautii ATCC 29863 TaxID=411475 RepID=G9YPA7_FLAPL|nr:hypothetical protein HMPREF0372_01336 [Flavonifractor plautii ATCC 29863]
MNRSPIFGYLALYQNLLITETGNCRDKGEIWRNKRRKADGAGAGRKRQAKGAFHCQRRRRAFRPY